MAAPASLSTPGSRLPADWKWGAAAIATLGFALVARWSVFWSENPDYVHGWLVPIFALYLAWERRGDRPRLDSNPSQRSRLTWLFCGLMSGIVMLFGRLLLEPFPSWPSALWLFSLGGWLAAWVFILLCSSAATARHFTFPLLFTATALPWPGWLELHIMIPLRTGIATIVAELIHTLGYPALAYGTIIEVGRGQVGIDEACSGVRSLHAALMIALLLGELFRFRKGRRFALIAVALGLSLASNLARTCFLAWQGAVRGPVGIDRWHDLAGTVQMCVALGGMAAVAWFWRHHAVESVVGVGMSFQRTTPWLRRYAVGLAGMVLVIELGTRLWFGVAPEASSKLDWKVSLPEARVSYRDASFTPTMQDQMRCDRHQSGIWESAKGQRRAGYVLDWQRGHIARQMIALHNPEICLSGAGQYFVGSRGEVVLPTPEGGQLRFRISEFSGPRGTFWVFYLPWDLDYARPLLPADDTSMARWLTFRWNEVLGHRGQFAARVFALAIYDTSNQTEATEAFLAEAADLVK